MNNIKDEIKEWEWCWEYLIRTDIGDDFSFTLDEFDQIFLIPDYGLRKHKVDDWEIYKSPKFYFMVCEEPPGIEISFCGDIEEVSAFEIVEKIKENLKKTTTRKIEIIKNKL